MTDIELADVLNDLEIGVVIQDSNLKITWANRAACRLLGRSAEELHGLDSYDPCWMALDAEGHDIPGPEHPAARALNDRASVRGVVMGVEIPGKSERSWLLVSAIPKPDGPGEITHVISTFANISNEHGANRELIQLNAVLGSAVEQRTHELTRANTKLSETSSRYEAVIRAMTEGVVIHGTDGTILSANPSAQEALGLSFEQMSGLLPVDPHWALTREDGSPLPQDEIPSEITQRTGKPCAGHILGVHRGAMERAWLSINTAPIESDGRRIGVVATFTDVTEARTTLDVLAETKRKIEWMINLMPGLLIERRVSASGEETLSFVSAGVEQVLGMSEAELRATPSAAFPRSAAEKESATGTSPGSAAGDAGSVEIEYRLKDKAGEWRWIRSTTAPAIRVEGESVYHSILFDVTREHQLNQSLRDSQRIEFMGTLAAGIAHNFNNMLAVILPNLDSARKQVEGPLAAELDDAYRAATAASDLVRGLAKLTHADPAAEFTEVPLGEVLDEVVEICRRTFDRQIQIDWEREEQPLSTLGQRSELQQILLNLAINARDALAGLPAPHIRLRLVKDRDFARIEIEDNGSGMSESTKAKLGEPFFTTKEAGKGTGLGLATVIGALRDMQGTLHWSSELGKGSTFVVTVPLVTTGQQRPEPPQAQPSPNPFEGCKILCIDDEPMVRVAVARMLSHLGAHVISAENGRAGLDLLERHPDQNLILVDLSMPGMTGDQVANTIRSKHPKLPVVLMTGYLAGDIPKSVNAVLTKPFNVHALSAALAPILA